MSEEMRPEGSIEEEIELGGKNGGHWLCGEQARGREREGERKEGWKEGVSRPRG